MDKVIEIKPKKVSLVCKLFVDASPELIAYHTQSLKDKLIKQCEENNLAIIGDVRIVDDQYHFSYVCEKEDCEYKARDTYDIDDCLRDHPEMVKHIGPYHLIVATCKVIPKKYERYKAYFETLQAPDIVVVPSTNED